MGATKAPMIPFAAGPWFERSLSMNGPFGRASYTGARQGMSAYRLAARVATGAETPGRCA